MADLAMLPVERGDGRRHADQHTDNHEQQDHQHQGHLPLGTEEETQDDHVVILHCKPEEQQEQKQPEDPDKQAHARNYP
jgi:hypothetical protein